MLRSSPLGAATPAIVQNFPVLWFLRVGHVLRTPRAFRNKAQGWRVSAYLGTDLQPGRFAKTVDFLRLDLSSSFKK
jgi:hypothetical protein